MCHGGTGKKRGGFDLTSYATAMKGGSDGVMIKAGDPDNSQVIKFLTGQLKKSMPMGLPLLPASDVQVIYDWIKEGAKEK